MKHVSFLRHFQHADARHEQVLKALLRDCKEPYCAAHVLALTLIECRAHVPSVNADSPKRPAPARANRSPALGPPSLEAGPAKSPPPAPVRRSRREKSAEGHAVPASRDVRQVDYIAAADHDHSGHGLPPAPATDEVGNRRQVARQ